MGSVLGYVKCEWVKKSGEEGVTYWNTTFFTKGVKVTKKSAKTRSVKSCIKKAAWYG